jgi:hypothetical protein
MYGKLKNCIENKIFELSYFLKKVRKKENCINFKEKVKNKFIASHYNIKYKYNKIKINIMII